MLNGVGSITRKLVSQQNLYSPQPTLLHGAQYGAHGVQPRLHVTTCSVCGRHLPTCVRTPRWISSEQSACCCGATIRLRALAQPLPSALSVNLNPSVGFLSYQHSYRHSNITRPVVVVEQSLGALIPSSQFSDPPDDNLLGWVVAVLGQLGGAKEALYVGPRVRVRTA